jgi:hypothetical protein
MRTTAVWTNYPKPIWRFYIKVYYIRVVLFLVVRTFENTLEVSTYSFVSFGTIDGVHNDKSYQTQFEAVLCSSVSSLSTGLDSLKLCPLLESILEI